MRHYLWIGRIVAIAALLIALPAIAGAPTYVGIGYPGSMSLTSPAVGTPGATQTITLNFQSNGTGGYSASLDALSVGGINAGDFAIVGGTCAAGSTLLNSGNQTCTVIVQYTPSTAAAESAQLNASCTTLGAVGGFVLTCNGTSGGLSSLAGALLAALVPLPFLDPKLLTALFALLLGVGVYYANRKQRA